MIKKSKAESAKNDIEVGKIIFQYSTIGMVILVAVLWIFTIYALIIPPENYEGIEEYSDALGFVLSSNMADINALDLSVLDATSIKYLFIAFQLEGIILLIIVTVFLYFLWQIAQQFCKGEFFNDDVVRQLTIVAVLFFVLSLYANNSSTIMSIFIFNWFYTELVSGVDAPLAQFGNLTFSIDLLDQVVAAALFMLPVAFRHGSALQTQADETL